MNINIKKDKIESIVYRINNDISIKLNFDLDNDDLSIETIDNKAIREAEEEKRRIELEKLEKEAKRKKLQGIINNFGEDAAKRIDFDRSKEIIDSLESGTYIPRKCTNKKVKNVIDSKYKGIDYIPSSPSVLSEKDLEYSLSTLPSPFTMTDKEKSLTKDRFNNINKKADEFSKKIIEDLKKNKTASFNHSLLNDENKVKHISDTLYDKDTFQKIVSKVEEKCNENKGKLVQTEIYKDMVQEKEKYKISDESVSKLSEISKIPEDVIKNVQ
jgi:hypothetical protein